MEKLIKRSEAAKILGVNSRTLTRWEEQNYLMPAMISPGRTRYYHLSKIEAFLENPSKTPVFEDQNNA